METPGPRPAGDVRTAFARLYDSCADRIHHYLVVQLGSRADADDVLQETFLRLVRERGRLDSVENPVAYAFAVARNESLRFLEQRSRKRGLPTHLAASDLFREAARDQGETRETAEWVAAALARLEPALRELVELKIYGGLTIREIGEVTGLPQGTVATRYRKALDVMRSRMAKECR
jgi:RNA polymerase sigma-70 factor (ECF subfamily)